MIVSASRRTDIPALYADWFLRRIQEGHVLVPNPWNRRRLGRVRFSPQVTDCIVFWTKNPRPMLEKLPALDSMGYRCRFSFTLTPYGSDVERGLPPKERLVDCFLRLAERIGPQAVDWRCDPLMLDARHPLSWLLYRFDALCGRLRGHTRRCIISFIRSYPHIASRIREMGEEEIRETARGLATIAAGHGIALQSCTQQWDLREFGIAHGACIDRESIEALLGCPITAKKDPGQPPFCGCLASVDIGMYGTCPQGCAYCYATRSEAALRAAMAAHDPLSPMLSGWPRGDESVSERTGPSIRDLQARLL